MALVSGQSGVDVPHTKVHLSSQQHLLLLLRLPDPPHSYGEVPGCLPPHPVQADQSHQLQETKVGIF